MSLLLAVQGGTGVIGTLASTEAGDTASAQAAIAISATLGSTEAGDTLSATGTISLAAVIGTLTVSEAADTGSGSTSIVVTGAGSTTEAGDTLSATGTLVSPPVTGTLAVTEAGDTLAGQTGVTVAATLTATESGDTVTSTGVVQSPVTISALRANLIYEIALLHGLVPGQPLSVSATERSAGNVLQTIDTTGGTVTMTTVSSDILSGSVDTWIDALAAVHGLTAPLVVTSATRAAGGLSQTIATSGGTTTVSAA